MSKAKMESMAQLLTAMNENGSSSQDRAEMYHAYLEESGYSPHIDGDGDVVFKHDGGNYYISVDKDPMFFRLVYPSFWSIDSEPERAAVMIAALHATAQVKVAKVFPVGDRVCCSIEVFCSPPEAFKPIFSRSLSAIDSGVKAFKTKLVEIAE